MSPIAAPNKQPCGSRPGPAAVHTHAPFDGGKTSDKSSPKASHSGESGVAKHGAPAPVGKGKSNPLK